MSNHFVAWFDGIEQSSRGEWCFDGLYLKERETLHQPVPVFEAVEQDLLRLDAWSATGAEGFFEKVSLNLSRGQKLLSPRPVLRRLIPGLKLSSRHAIYRFEVGNEIYLVPALFFINELYFSCASAAPYLLQPGVLENYVDPAPELVADSVRIRLPPSMVVSRCKEDTACMLAWMALTPEAPKCWGSIWFNAWENRIDLRLPDVSMTGRLGGYVVDGMRFVCWSREVTFDRGLPPVVVVSGKRGRQKTFRRAVSGVRGAITSDKET